MIKQLKNGAYEYNEKDFLGQGSFAKVYKGTITKNNRVIAVRILPLKLIKQYGEKIKEIIKGQVAVLKQLSQSDSIDSLFTTRIYDCFLTQNNVTMILEFCPDGNLQDIISKRGALPQKQALDIMYQLARGLQFIAKQKVVHRDIKPDNIFLKKQKVFMLYKLGDFGFAVKKQINKQTVGTPIFMSPQLFKGQAYGSQVDVWAFGLLCHYILFKQYYFIANTQKQIQNRVLNEHYQLKNHQLSRISSQMADFLTRCLQRDKSKRMRATQLTSHPVFNSVRDRIQTMAQQIRNLDSQFQSQLMQSSPKGIIANIVMKYQFLYNLAGEITKLDPSTPTSLYMIKYNLANLYSLRQAYNQKQNFINHPGWGQFVSSPKYNQMYKLIDSVFTTHQHCFQTQYNRHMTILKSKFGPNQLQKFHSNLGNGPYDFINPQPIALDLKNNWRQQFKSRGTNNLYMFVKGLQCIVAFQIYQNININLDFVKLTMNNTTIQERQKTILLAIQGSS